MSYKLVYLIDKSGKKHIIVNILKYIPLSNNTISRRIGNLVSDIETDICIHLSYMLYMNKSYISYMTHYV